MRVAREMGGLQLLLPEGIDRLDDLPYPLFDAIRVGLMYIGFQELPRDEQPPRRIWRDGDKLTAWFEEVDRKRQEKYSGKSIADKEIDGPVSRNAAAEDLFAG